jgi:CheY-like chemotaxis protein/tetratricopeptide (TPR) repeat protein
VLVVHASPAWAERVAERLGADGWATEVIEGGERALDRFVQEPTDAVVVDLDLRGRDGAATIESLRWAPGGRALPIVLTGIAAASDELAALARELGVQCVPSGDPDEIVRSLGQAVPRPPSAAVELESFDDDLYTSAPPRLPTVPPPSMDPEAGREGVDVERRARALAKVAEVRGSLEELEVAEVLTRLADLRATGALVVELEGHARTTTGESPKKVVFFRNGVPIHVRSNLEDECLGQLLVRRGVIDRATLDESLARVRDGDGRQGGILVAMGALEPRDLREALEHQQETKLLALFAWRRGSFHFSEAMTPPAETITLELSLAEIVARAFRTQLPIEAIETASAPFLDRYVWASELGWRGLAQALEEDERALLDAVDGHATLRTLLERRGSARAAALRAFHAARCLGCVTFREVALDRGRAADRSAAASKRLRELLSSLRGERYAEVFELAPDTDLPTLRRRGAALRAEARKLREDLPIALHPLSDELHHRLGRAEAVLVSDRERTDSDTVLPSSSAGASSSSASGASTSGASSASSASSEPSPVAATPFSPLRAHEAVTRELPAAMQIPVRSAAQDPPTRELEAPSTSPSERTDEHPVPPSGRPSEAMGGASSDGADERAERHDHATAEHRAPPAVVGDEVLAAAKEASPAAELDARVERMLQAERAMRRARRAVDRDQLASAREAVAKAVQLVPDEPEFAAELAWIDAKLASTEERSDALARLDEAARLAPKNARIHVLRAEVLLAMGADADARAAYERALAANPDEPKALAGLRALIR